MSSDRNGLTENVFFSREIGLRQAVGIGLRAALPLLAFVALGPMAALSGTRAPLTLVVGAGIWLLTVLSYLELASITEESGAHDTIASQRSGIIAYTAALALLLANIVATALLARALGELLIPLLPDIVPQFSPNIVLTGFALLAILAGLALALRRRQTWRTSDDLLLLIGLAATVVTVLGGLVAASPAETPRSSPLVNNISSAAFPVLLLLAVEAVSEWKSSLRTGRNTRFSRIVALVLLVLVGAALALLVAGILLDLPGLAKGGLAAIVRELPVAWQAVSLLFALTLITAIRTTLLQSNRLLRQIVREGYLPGAGIAQRRRGRLLFSAVSVAILAGLAAFLPETITIPMLVGSMMVYAGAINLANILYRPKETPALLDSAFRLPFPPLIPGLSLFLIGVLAVAAGLPMWLSGAAVVTFVLISYLLYGKEGHDRADASKALFRGRKTTATAESAGYRVLVPLTGDPAKRSALLDAAIAIARPHNGEVLPLEIVELEPQQTRAEGARVARERNQILRWSMEKQDGTVTINPLTRISHSVAQGIIDTAKDVDAQVIVVTWERSASENQPLASGVELERARIVADLARGASCKVVALDGELPETVKRILVPTGGGPNAPDAAKLALSMAANTDAEVVGYIVVRENSEGATARAEEVVRSTFAGLEGADKITVRTQVSDETIATLLIAEANNGYDLVLMGASNESILDNILFGNLPERVARETAAPVLMVRAEQAASEAFVRLTWGRVQAAAPVLNMEDQIFLYRNLRRGARPNINYFVLIVLSAIIATLGLWQNSTAVIIGAMLVAPLMTPILASSLGIVMGDGRTIRVAFESMFQGILLALAISAFIAFVLPGDHAGSEILGRTEPTLLDLGVALVSGMAGAYALARREVSAALPGVAIAAALMPPLCTIGIGIAMFSGPIATGALLLFTTNLIAIIVAGILVFVVLGMRPPPDRAREQNFRRGLALGLVMLVLITVPLIWPNIRSRQQARQQRSVESLVKDTAGDFGVKLVSADSWEDKGTTVVVARVQAVPETVSEELVQQWSADLAAQYNHPVNLIVEVEPIIQFQATSQ